MFQQKYKQTFMISTYWYDTVEILTEDKELPIYFL